MYLYQRAQVANETTFQILRSWRLGPTVRFCLRHRHQKPHGLSLFLSLFCFCSFEMNLNYTSPVPQMPAQRSTSFFIEDILLHKPKPLREVFPSPFSNSLASRMPFLEYGYPLMPTPILAPHPHHPLHKPEHHPYFFTSGKQPTLKSGLCLKKIV